ncbi:MAG: transcription antitermination factor NusB [Bacteroidales bacterium]|jgi:N utilization substance protein B|nr:transcription antitermination factor NusB [Bacteroidales bacterium]
MISRRLLRIKALMALYAYNRREDNNLVQAEKELMFSIAKTFDLYHYLLLLVLEIADVAGEKIDLALQKHVPTPEDLNPNRRFIDNQVIAQLRSNKAFNSFINSSKLSWANNRHIPRTLYNNMLSWPAYADYMTNSQPGYSADRKFIMNLITRFLIESEVLQANLEEQSIYWNDDLEYVSAMIEKTLKKFRAGNDGGEEMMPLFRNEEDREFVQILFRKTVIDTEKCSELIDHNTTNWEVERIALMDILVMQLAITEILEFPEIPIKVTLNEYIEIAKYYCTSKSSTFVNGILDNIVKEMRQKGMFTKTGRGLVGEAVIEED